MSLSTTTSLTLSGALDAIAPAASAACADQDQAEFNAHLAPPTSAAKPAADDHDSNELPPGATDYSHAEYKPPPPTPPATQDKAAEDSKQVKEPDKSPPKAGDAQAEKPGDDSPDHDKRPAIDEAALAAATLAAPIAIPQPQAAPVVEFSNDASQAATADQATVLAAIVDGRIAPSTEVAAAKAGNGAGQPAASANGKSVAARQHAAKEQTEANAAVSASGFGIASPDARLTTNNAEDQRLDHAQLPEDQTLDIPRVESEHKGPTKSTGTETQGPSADAENKAAAVAAGDSRLAAADKAAAAAVASPVPLDNTSPSPSPPFASVATAQATTPVHARLPAEALAQQPAATPRRNISDMETVRLLSRVARAFSAAQPGDGEIRLRLSPPELGSLKLAVQVHDGNLVARLETETTAARTALIDNLPALRERLAEQGVRIERFDVDLMQRQPGGMPDQPGGRQPQPPAEQVSVATLPRPRLPAAVPVTPSSIAAGLASGLNVIV